MDVIKVITEEVPQIILTGIVGPQGPGGGIQWRGAWDSETEYAPNDVVGHSGRTWITAEGCTGKEPGVDPEWELFVDVGDIDGGTL